MKKIKTVKLLLILLISLNSLISIVNAWAIGLEEPHFKFTRTQYISKQQGYVTDVIVCEQTPNLIPNSGFEQGIGYQASWEEAGKCDFSESTLGHTSPTSAEINVDAPSNKSCMFISTIDQIPVEPGTNYDYATWVKTNLLEGNAYLAITFWKHHGTWKQVGGPALTSPISDTNGGWAQITGSVEAPEGAEFARIEATLAPSSLGTVQFDNIFFGKSVCLELSMTDTPDPVQAGGTLVYTITYSNTGREKTTGIELFEIYDDYIQFLSSQPSPFLESGNVWKIPMLEPNSSNNIVINTVVDSNTEQRAYLFNEAHLSSEEIIGLVTESTITSIQPVVDSCEAEISLFDNPSSGLSQGSLHHSILVKNVGSSNGEFNLLGSSSQNWGVSIEPISFDLLAGQSKIIAVDLEVPLDAPPGILNTTTITANVTCGNSGTDTVETSVSANLSSPLYLPITMNSYFDSNVWESEENNTCGDIDADGPLFDHYEYYGYTNDIWDWFKIDVANSGNLIISLTIDSGNGIQVFLLDEKCIHELDRDDTPDLNDTYKLQSFVAQGRYFLGIYVESEHDQNYDHPYTISLDIP